MIKQSSDPKDKEFPGIALLQSRAPQGINGGIGQGLAPERSLERNPSVLSRKELIKQEYNLLLETRLPNIMHLMNSDKSLGLGMGSISKTALETEEEIRKKEKFTNKQSVDYDDTDFLQKMFSNGDKEIKNLEVEKKTPAIEKTPKIVKNPSEEDLLSKKMGAHKGPSVIQNDSDPL